MQYANTGWRQVGGQWVYLHAGGAIGADGPVEGIRVRLPDQLANFQLPSPPAGEQLREAVRSSLRPVLKPGSLVTSTIATVLVVASYRAVVGRADFSIGIYGKSWVR